MPHSLRSGSTHLGPCVPRCARLLRGTALGATAPHASPSPHPGARRCERGRGSGGGGCVRDPCCGQPSASGPPEPALPARADSLPEPGRARSVRGPVAAAGRPTGALGQLPPPRPRTRNSLLLLLKNPSEHVYIEPHKLPARAFTIHEESEPALGKWGHQDCGAKE